MIDGIGLYFECMPSPKEATRETVKKQDEEKKRIARRKKEKAGWK